MANSRPSRSTDFVIHNEGTIVLFRPRTSLATAWLETNLAGPTTWWGDSLVVEHRYAASLAAGMHQDGLVLGRGWL